MKCDNCKVTIKPEFTYAIQNNQCPACGGSIMKQAKLASYLSLRTLLENNIVAKGVDTDALASLIVANFEIKQLFKEELQKDVEEGIIEVEEETKVIASKEPDEDPDAEYKTRQKAEAKAILQKMRDEVLEGAVKDRYGLGDEDNLLLGDEEVNMYELVDKETKAQKQNVILSGGGGKNSFSRSG